MAPNRIAALLAALAPIGAALVAVLNGLPPDWQGPVLMVAAVCVTAIAIVWLIGWQRHEQRKEHS